MVQLTIIHQYLVKHFKNPTKSSNLKDYKYVIYIKNTNVGVQEF